MFLDNFEQPLCLTNHGIRLPEFKLSDEDCIKYNIPKESSNLEILTAICRIGFKEKLNSGFIPRDSIKEYSDRVKYELSVLEKTNFADYILLVWDVMRFVRNNNIARGRARGSAAGSLVNYLVGITDVDSIKYGLFWERFISEARAQTVIVDGVKYLAGSSPDVDIDIGDEDRYKVIDYVSKKYNGKFVKLSTTGTLTTKILTKEIGKIFGRVEEEMNEITGHIPVVFGKTPDPTKCYDESDVYKRFIDENPNILEISQYLYESINHVGSHASAYSLSFHNLEDFMPCQLGTDDEMISTYDMYEAQNLSVKLDLLGVQTINLIQKVANRVGVDLDTVDINSWDNIYKYLQQLEHPYGLFQISGHTAIKANNKVKPKNIDHIAGILAVGRPGALSFLDQYADYTNNGEVQKCPVVFYDILKDTGGVCLYQETLMSLFCKLGFSLVEANTIRDIVGKKKRDKIAEWEPKIYQKAKDNNISEEAAKYVWEIANASADYSFNRSHAIGYGLTTLLSVYCKFNYPKEFFIEALEMSQKKSDSFSEIELVQQELPYFGVKLLPPDLIKSDMSFKIEGNDIRFSLSAIKGVADKALPKLQTFLNRDKTNKFQIFYAAKDAGLNIAVLSALIQAGCLESISVNRSKLTLEAQIWGKLNEREREYCLANGYKYNYDLCLALKDYKNWSDGKPFRESRLKTIRSNSETYIQIYNKNKEYPMFCNFMYERALLGFAWSHNIRQIFEKEHPDLQSADKIKNQLENNEQIKYVGTVGECKRWKSKKGVDCFKMDLSDETGTISVMMTGDKLARYTSSASLPQEDEITYVEGRKGEGIIFIDRMEVQNYKIVFNLRDLKKLKHDAVTEV